MTRKMDVKRATTEELVEAFRQASAKSGQAILLWQTAIANRWLKFGFAIRNELGQRPGDQRRALLPLRCDHDMHVRLMAATETLVFEPAASRQVIEDIAQSGMLPHSADAGMTLWNLDRGVFKPK